MSMLSLTLVFIIGFLISANGCLAYDVLYNYCLLIVIRLFRLVDWIRDSFKSAGMVTMLLVVDVSNTADVCDIFN